MKKILVPCDFSKPATNAFRYALDLAKQSKGIVHLLHVIELPVLGDSIIMPVLDFEKQLLLELRLKHEVEFEKLVKKHNKDNQKLVTKIEFGTIEAVIHNYIEKEDIDLIVMGSHGASGFKEFLIGSNAEKIVRKATVPVLTIKNYFKGVVKNIVFPNTLDTEHQEELVMKVKALQNFFDAHLHVVWINTPVSFTSDITTYKRLEAFAKRYMLKDFTPHVFNYQNEEDGILRFTQRIKGQLIAMGTHGRRGIAHVINGSIAEDVVNHGENLIWTYALKSEAVPS